MGHLYRHIDRFLDSVHHPAFQAREYDDHDPPDPRAGGPYDREASTMHGVLRRTEWHVDPDALDGGKRLKGGTRTSMLKESPQRIRILTGIDPPEPGPWAGMPAFEKAGQGGGGCLPVREETQPPLRFVPVNAAFRRGSQEAAL